MLSKMNQSTQSCFLKVVTLLIFLLCLVSGNEFVRGQTGTMSGISFTRTNEPREQAFSILVPKGWQAEGGILRVNPIQAGGPLNSMEAKCDLAYKSDAAGTVSFHILPDIVYAHTGIGGGFFAAGSNYQGAQVRQLTDAPSFLKDLFSYLHPNAQDAKQLAVKRLPGEIAAIDQGLSYTNRLLAQIGLQTQQYKSDAAGGIFEYTEKGVRYREVILTGIVNMPAALTWKNTRTLAFRAPARMFEQWRPVMDIMRSSVRFNPKWILKESEGQQQRADMVMKIYDEVRRIDREILRKTTVNREEIMNDNYLVLTGQEDFVNPHTGETETDTDAYRFRWETPGGDIYYTDSEDENPNLFLQRTDYKRTPVRKRRNE
jgi:hypothetical protein